MLVIFMMASTLLTACGGGGTSDDSANGGDAAIDYSKTIVFYSTQGDSLQKVTANAIASFEAKHPGWKVEHIQPGGYDETKDKIVSDFQAASQPDLAYCYPDHVAQYLKTGKVVDLNDFINDEEIGFSAEEIADFVPGYYNEGYARNFAGYESAGLEADSMITLPFVKSTELMYVNKTALDALDLPIATTWDELWAQCEDIVAKYPTATPLGYDSEANWFITMCEQLNSPYTSATGNHFLFDNAQNKEFVAKFKDMYDRGLFTTQKIYGGYTSGLFCNTTDTTAKRSFMSIGSSAGATHQVPDVDGAFEVGITSIPQANPDNGKVISQGPSLVMFKKQNQDEVVASWLLMRFLTTDIAFQAEMSMASGYVPNNTAVLENDKYLEFLDSANGYDSGIAALSAKVCMDQSDYYFTSPAFVGSSDARDQVGSLLQSVFETNVAESGKTLSQIIDEAFAFAVAECEAGQK